MKKILILCTGNSCRSQMAEACLKSLMNLDHYSIYSAGVEAHGINPFMKIAMQKKGYSLKGHTSNMIEEYKDEFFDTVVTVCNYANEYCPYFQNANQRFHHSFEDPANANGTDEEKIMVYEKVRDEIIEFCHQLVEKL